MVTLAPPPMTGRVSIPGLLGRLVVRFSDPSNLCKLSFNINFNILPDVRFENFLHQSICLVKYFSKIPFVNFFEKVKFDLERPQKGVFRAHFGALSNSEPWDLL